MKFLPSFFVLVIATFLIADVSCENPVTAFFKGIFNWFSSKSQIPPSTPSPFQHFEDTFKCKGSSCAANGVRIVETNIPGEPGRNTFHRVGDGATVIQNN